ncbi:MAG: hypothetical protein MJE77_07170 [Proteobacteria bacterium]|nr:hypothetical protein [Pseudomonadota bacterium]
MSLIGARVVRVEDPALLAGRGQFTDNVNVPGALFMKFVLSAEPHANVISVDVTRTAAMSVRSNKRLAVALCNMADTPVRAVAVERAIANGASHAEAASVVDRETRPVDDAKANAAYRRPASSPGAPWPRQSVCDGSSQAGYSIGTVVLCAM